MNSIFLRKLIFLLNSCFDPFDPQVGSNYLKEFELYIDIALTEYMFSATILSLFNIDVRRL